ncbi:MAG: hypothetical protein ABEI78_02470 [Candidatus Nanohaloarchaea archaeon]
MSEEIGFHKGAVQTLLHEKKELSRLLQIVNSQLENHLNQLEEKGVDTDELIENLGKKEKRGKNNRKQGRRNETNKEVSSRNSSSKEETDDEEDVEDFFEDDDDERDFNPLS